MRSALKIGFVVALAGCATLSPLTLATDALTCAEGIGTEVAAGQADPALSGLGKNPSVAQIVQALKDAQALLPATIVACTAFAEDLKLAFNPAAPPAPAPAPKPAQRMERPRGAVPNPWGH